MVYTKDKVKVSVIIVTWNVEKVISECLDTFFKYSDLESEVIIVDNASKDNTCSIIKDKYGDNVKLIELEDNIGFSKANNVGLEIAKGEYIFFLNPDVIFIQSIMDNMKKILDNNEEIGIVSPRLLNVDKSLQISYSNFPNIKRIIFDDFRLGALLSKKYKFKYYQSKVNSDKSRLVDWTYGAAHFCRRDEVEKINRYPDSYFMYGEDTEICMAFFSKLKKKVYYDTKCELIHIGGYSEKQVVNSRKVTFVTNSTLYFINKYYGKAHMNCARVLLIINRIIKLLIMSCMCLFSKSEVYRNKKYKFKIAIVAMFKYNGQAN